VSQRIPLEYVEGVDETTIWLWPDSPDPVTVRVESELWERMQRAAGDDDLEEYVGQLVADDLEGGSEGGSDGGPSQIL
jgi:hypothetical protein